MKDIIVLGIESSCDETSVAVVKNGREVLSNVIDTQIKIHEQFGGVVPEIASRNHIEAISRVAAPIVSTQGGEYPTTRRDPSITCRIAATQARVPSLTDGSCYACGRWNE